VAYHTFEQVSIRQNTKKHMLEASDIFQLRKYRQKNRRCWNFLIIKRGDI
jgi:hypothetical protein